MRNPHRLLTLAAVACLMGFGFAQQAGANPVEPADTLTKQRFEIAARPLRDALQEFVQQTGLNLRLELPVGTAFQTHAVSGSFTIPQALRTMLSGSGLEAHFSSDRTLLIHAVSETPVYNLQAVEVVAVRNRGYATVRTVTATKTDTPLRDTPQSISVVTRDVIADQSMLSMADVIKYIPGATMGQGEGHRDAPTMRGNSSTADFFVDGVRDDAQYFRDLYNVERVEALKGSNAMIFGRGGGGGVINRVTKEPELVAAQSIRVEAGTDEHRRGTLDISRPLTDNFAVRLNGMYEDSRSYRDEVGIERKAVNPTFLYMLSDNTRLSAGYEYFTDERTVDRGIPSFNGMPSSASRSVFFGNPDASFATTTVHHATALLEHRLSDRITVRNRARFTDYDKFYQNSYAASALNDSGVVSIGAYNSATPRRNFFNQTEAVLRTQTGRLGHTLLGGVEIGRQRTENFRNTGYYNNTATTYAVDFSAPTVRVPITFRQSASDADNNTVVDVVSAYVQDQIAITKHVQAIGGVRFERFDVAFHNNRNDTDLSRKDDLISPRAGLIVKPIEQLSVYGSYSVSYLPSSGDQFGSLTATTQTLEPEQFTNYELGTKWDIRPNLSISLAAFQLDRTNTSAPDPQDATRIVQTGSQRAKGGEVSIAGDITTKWHVVAGVAMQKAEITSRTSAAVAGQVVPLVPERTMSLWNRYDVTGIVGLGLGVYSQSDMFAAIDNTVTLPGYTRIDGAVFIKAHPLVRVQINVENLLDEEYFGTSHGNNNILPGAGRTIKIALTTRR